MLDFITIIVTSSVVASIVGPVVNEVLMVRRNWPSERLAALNAAVGLEGYALHCADKVADHRTAIDSAGAAGDLISGVPELPEIPVVAAFVKRERARVADRLASFPQDVRQADQAAAFWWDLVSDMDSARNEAVKQTACVGLQALELARSLREAFTLPRRDLVFGEYNVRTTLEREASVNVD
ncbi:hypothetical protein [Halofilum ochraceum]|uniref:hypothetical protein n=1 Tax=Halofilum ochraceum TaxID=1611323 RepID=UPI0008D9857B|nr:hypothetical protein [Halofilum ochraceum]